MPAFKPFTFKEPLPKGSLAKLPIELMVSEESYPEVLLLRLLSGTVDVRNTTSKKVLQLRTQYLTNGHFTNKRISENRVLRPFKQESISIKKITDYYKNCFKFGNRNLFQSLLFELCHYFFHKDKNSHAIAFLHLYRCLELISYCFPLFYVAKSTSYEKTFTTLKDFFHKVEGELPFFRSFVTNHLFRGNLILDERIEINILAPGPELQKQYFDAIKKLCDANRWIEVLDTDPHNQIIIPRSGLISLVIDLRNRYFHLLTGDFNDNFQSGVLDEVDLFYKLINDEFLNWLSLIYFEILKKVLED